MKSILHFCQSCNSHWTDEGYPMSRGIAGSPERRQYVGVCIPPADDNFMKVGAVVYVGHSEIRWRITHIREIFGVKTIKLSHPTTGEVVFSNGRDLFPAFKTRP